jgi:hypothetical protein
LPVPCAHGVVLRLLAVAAHTLEYTVEIVRRIHLMGLVLQTSALRLGADCEFWNGMLPKSMVEECLADCDYIEAVVARYMLLVLIHLRGARSPA